MPHVASTAPRRRHRLGRLVLMVVHRLVTIAANADWTLPTFGSRRERGMRRRAAIVQAKLAHGTVVWRPAPLRYSRTRPETHCLDRLAPSPLGSWFGDVDTDQRPTTLACRTDG